MNKERRQRIETMKGKLEELKAEAEEVRDDEDAAYEAMPEGLKESERGQKSEAACSQLQDLASYLESALEAAENLTAES